MDATGRKILASVVSPLVVTLGIELLLNFESRGHSAFSLFGMPTIIAYIWFVVGLLPFVFRWRLKNLQSLISLVAIGAVSCSIFFLLVLYLFLSMLGHGGTHANLGGLFAEVFAMGALSGGGAATLFGVIDGFLSEHQE
jgi:uncharacterized membrane protein (GlpM family)